MASTGSWLADFLIQPRPPVQGTVPPNVGWSPLQQLEIKTILKKFTQANTANYSPLKDSHNEQEPELPTVPWMEASATPSEWLGHSFQ